MELRQLKYFLAVADARSFARGAARQYISRQAISKAIFQLEAELNVELFIRDSRGAFLTPEGTMFYERVRNNVLELEQLQSEMQMLGSRFRQVVRIAFSIGTSDLYEKLLQQFLARQSNLSVNYFECAPQTCTDLLTKQQADVVVTSVPPNNRQFYWHPIFSSHLVVMVSKTARDWQTLPLCCFDDGQTEELCRNAGFSVQPVGIDLGRLGRMAREDGKAVILPKVLFPEYIPGIHFLPLSQAQPWQLYRVSLASKENNTLFPDTLDLLTEQVLEHPSMGGTTTTLSEKAVAQDTGKLLHYAVAEKNTGQKPAYNQNVSITEQKESITMYTGRERILCALRREKADRLPVFDIVNKPDMYTDLLHEDNYESRGRLCVRLAKKLGMDAVTVHSAPYTCLIPPKAQFDTKDTFTDRFGITCKVTDTSWPLGMAINAREVDEELLEIIRNAPITEEDVQQVKEAVEEANGEIAVFGSVRSAFGFLFILLGLENLADAIYNEPELLQEIIDAADDYWTRLGLKLIEAGCDALYVANDMGMNGRTLISPNQLRQFFFPSFRKQVCAWKAAGGRVLLHSCGNINEVLEDLADIGIDAINNIQVRAGMDLASAKARIGNRVTIVGNVDATGIMCQNDRQLISDAICQTVEAAGQDGGLIIATDHSFHEGIPTENVIYFLEEARRIGTF